MGPRGPVGAAAVRHGARRVAPLHRPGRRQGHAGARSAADALAALHRHGGRRGQRVRPVRVPAGRGQRAPAGRQNGDDARPGDPPVPRAAGDEGLAHRADRPGRPGQVPRARRHGDGLAAAPVRRRQAAAPERRRVPDVHQRQHAAPHPPTRDALHGKQSDHNDMDEGWSFDEPTGADLFQAITPTQATRPGAQTWVWSTMGDAASVWFHALVERAEAEAEGVAGFAGASPRTRPVDLATIVAHHPAVGHTQTRGRIRAAPRPAGTSRPSSPAPTATAPPAAASGSSPRTTGRGADRRRAGPRPAAATPAYGVGGVGAARRRRRDRRPGRRGRRTADGVPVRRGDGAPPRPRLAGRRGSWSSRTAGRPSRWTAAGQPGRWPTPWSWPGWSCSPVSGRTSPRRPRTSATGCVTTPPGSTGRACCTAPTRGWTPPPTSPAAGSSARARGCSPPGSPPATSPASRP